MPPTCILIPKQTFFISLDFEYFVPRKPVYFAQKYHNIFKHELFLKKFNAVKNGIV